jgi:hypothetical protein
MTLPNDRVLGYHGTGDVVYDCGDVGYYRVGATRGAFNANAKRDMNLQTSTGNADALLGVGARIQPEAAAGAGTTLPTAQYNASSVEETWTGYIGAAGADTNANHYVVRPVD